MPATSYKPDFPARVRVYAAGDHDGCTLEEIGKFFGVTKQTIIRWVEKYPDFKEVLDDVRALADYQVVQSLYKRAIGYTPEPDVDVIEDAVDGEVVRTRTITKTKHVPPDVTAQIFWLKNRDKEHWRDVHRVENTGADGGPIEYQMSDEEVENRAREILAKRSGNTS